MRWAWMGALLGCSETTGTEPRTWDGDFLIDAIVIDCDTQSWTYDVYTLGWGDVITVDIVLRSYGAVVLRENHQLPELEYGDDWAHHQLTLDQASPYDAFDESTSTALACEGKTFVTYGFAAWRYDGEMQECVAWGIDPAGEFPDCANWGENGHGAI